MAIADVTTDDTPFLIGAPTSLAAGQSYSGNLFTATLSNSITPGNYQGSFSVLGGADATTYTTLSSTTASVSVASLQANVSLGNLAATYTGSVQSVAAITTPSGLQVNLSYNGSATAPTEAGSYAVVAAIADANYGGTVTGTLTISRATQTITFTPSTQAFSSSPITLVGTASSGQALSYEVVSGPAKLSGTNTLTLTGTGKVTLEASQSGNDDYLAAPNVTQSFTVAAASNFGLWESQSGFFTQQQLNNASVSALTATPQNDGIANLLKYLYDINPSVPIGGASQAALPVGGRDTTTTPGTTYLTLTYRKYALATGITINVETSPDLQPGNWTTVTPDITQQIGTDPLTLDPIMEVEVNTNGADREFIRMSVSQP